MELIVFNSKQDVEAQPNNTRPPESIRIYNMLLQNPANAEELKAFDIETPSIGNSGSTPLELLASKVTEKPDSPKPESIKARLWLNLLLSYTVLLAKAEQETSLNDVMNKAFKRSLGADAWRQVRHGALIVHAIIDTLVQEGLNPANATALLIIYGPYRLYQYRKLASSTLTSFINCLKNKSGSSNYNSNICIAKEIARQDSSLCVKYIHDKLGYKFFCTTCHPESFPMCIRPPAGPFPELLYNIRAYFENSCQAIRLDDHGVLLTPNGAKWHNDLCSAFDSYCFTATMLKKREMYIEFRRAVYKATILVERILRDEHPRTLVCFFEVLIHLIHNGLFEVASCLRHYIKCMAATVIEEGNPWGRICWLLGELDSESLNSAMAEAWKCTTDTFDNRLGCTSPLAVSVRLDYIKRVYGAQDYGREESLLRELFDKLGTLHLSTPRVILNLAHNLNRQKLHEKAREMALTVFALVQGHKMYAGKVVEKIEAVKIVSHCFFNEGQIANAEQTLRLAIDMTVEQWGEQHSWVSEFMTVLEGWLRSWDREEEADTIRGEIDNLISKDGNGKQLDLDDGI